jgi:hypothetical protein
MEQQPLCMLHAHNYSRVAYRQWWGCVTLKLALASSSAP